MTDTPDTPALPTAGGTWQQEKDGSLVRVARPAAAPPVAAVPAPPEPAAPQKPKKG